MDTPTAIVAPTDTPSTVEVQPVPNGMAEINDLETFAETIIQWHAVKTALLTHMQDMPEGIEMAVDGETLAGDKLIGFKRGVQFALSQISELPFVSVDVDAEDGQASNGQPN